MIPRRLAGAAVVILTLAGIWLWHSGGSAEERQIAARLHALADEVNASTTDGLGTVARAGRIGQFFAPDVSIDLGQGTPPIQGRETLMGMASRLQPRTAAFELSLDDVQVERIEGDRADVILTVVIRRRSVASGEESIDAREFSAELLKADGAWRISRVTAVDTLR